MTLRERQSKFVSMVALLIQFAYEHGFEMTFGEAWAREGHKEGSYHYKRLAIDLNLFRDVNIYDPLNDIDHSGNSGNQLAVHGVVGRRMVIIIVTEKIKSGSRGLFSPSYPSCGVVFSIIKSESGGMLKFLETLSLLLLEALTPSFLAVWVMVRNAFFCCCSLDGFCLQPDILPEFFNSCAQL